MKKTWRSGGAVVWAAVALMALTGCDGFFVPVTNGGGGGTTNTGDYVYVANANPSQASIAAFSVSSSGKLTGLSGSPYTLSFIPTALAVTPANTYLYVGGTTGLYAYSIASNGTLTLVGNAGASIPVASIAISPDGKYLFALQSNIVIGTNTTPATYSVTLNEYQIGSSGALALVANQAYTTTSGTFTPKMVTVSPNGKLVAIAAGSAGTGVFPLTSGLLTSSVNTLAEANLSADNAVAFDSTNGYLYIARSGTSTGLGLYRASSSGALTQVGTTLAATGSQPSGLVLDASGKYAYVSNQGDANVSGYSVTAGSLPTALTSSPYNAGTSPVGLVEENTGKYLLAVNSSGSPDLELWTIGSDGSLTLSDSSATGTDPTLPIALAVTH